MREVSIIIVNWNTRERLKQCLASIMADSEAISPEVIVADNASVDGSAQMVRAAFPG